MAVTGADQSGTDPTERVQLLMRDLRTSEEGLSSLEAVRRLERYGRNELVRRARSTWPSELLHQLTHPLALLLWAASALAFIAGIPEIGAAVVVVILLNAGFAFAQERQAERAVEALAEYLPPRAVALRDGRRTVIPAAELVPGDVLLITEGDGISADCRLFEGSLEVEMAALTGESVSVERDAAEIPADAATRSPLEARDLVFSGTFCTSGEASAFVFATGMHTELGRIAALSERQEVGESPLERQIRRVAKLIAVVAVVMGVAFVPIATLGAGLPFSDALVLAIGLLVANVPEGLLPVVTLALAVAVRELARRGALVKRLSAVETLGSTTVICTDKTGTLTENRMRVDAFWTPGGGRRGASDPGPAGAELTAMLHSMIDCCDAEPVVDEHGNALGDATELAMLAAARAQGVPTDTRDRRSRREREFRFDPMRKTMTTIGHRDGGIMINVKGAPESVLPRCSAGAEGVMRQVTEFAGQGLRVLAIAGRDLDPYEEPAKLDRDAAESGLTLYGLAALIDPPRESVPGAVAQCHGAGILIHVVTGDNGLTALSIARSVGIADDSTQVVDGAELDAKSEAELRELLAAGRGLIFSRSSPEAKLRIADALRDLGEVVAMTGDGVNDAPALRAADIGVAMGVSGTEVAREAATIVLTDDDFASIAAAVRGGRRVYANIRKFLFYILAHTTPEVVPYVVYGLAGGSLPLPMTVMQILAIDVGTEILPSLALGREPAEPGIMRRPPRPRDENVIGARMIGRAWLYLGMISAALCMGTFLWVLQRSGWSPGDATGEGSPLHDDYVRATTMTFLALVSCQVGIAFASRSERASLREIGFFSNPALLWGVASSIAIALAIAYVPFLQPIFDTATPRLDELLVILPFPLITWLADEGRRRLLLRRRR